jgi:hypothetical protein
MNNNAKGDRRGRPRSTEGTHMPPDQHTLTHGTSLGTANVSRDPPTAALRYADAGWPVFMLSRTKRP